MPTPLQLPDNLERWITETVGISRKLLASLDDDDDWTFVIKMHGILEAVLNHLLLSQFNNPALTDIISKLETNNERTGKIAFINACDLLPENARGFIRLFSQLRNRAVHDVKNFDLNLADYLAALDGNKKKNWKTALTSWMVSKPSEQFRDRTLCAPRDAIYNCCMMILIRSHGKHSEAQAQRERIREATEFFRKRPMFEGFGKP